MRSDAALDDAQIAIADKSPIVREGLKSLIGSDPRFDVVATVGSGEELLKLIVERPIDIAIVGWTLPGLSGGDVLADLKNRHAQTRVIIYTGETSTIVLRRAVQLGARAFVSKGEEAADLLAAVVAVAHGRLSFPHTAMHALSKSPLDDITSRELQLLSALADGLSNAQIAYRFGISNNTVKYHLKNLYDKLGVSNRVMAVTLLLSETGQTERSNRSST